MKTTQACSYLLLPLLLASSLAMHAKIKKHPKLIKTLRFGANRKNYLQDWDAPFDPQSLVRVGIPPLEMPDAWTWCSWYLQDFQNREFTFFDMAGTVSGRSILNHTDPESEGSFRNQTKLQKSIFLMDLWWETLETMWGYKWDNMKQVEPLYYTWRFFCVAVEIKKATIVIYIDGEIIDQKELQQGENGFAWWVEKNTNATSGEITDIWLGGMPAYGGGYYWNSFGRMSQIHWFDRLLTHNEMVGMTTCGGTQLKGDLIDWETTSFEFKWEQHYDIQEVWVSMDEICPEKDYGGIYVPSFVEFADSVEMCSTLKRHVIAIESPTERENGLDLMRDINEGIYYQHQYYANGWRGIYNLGIAVLSAFTDQNTDLIFNIYYTGTACNHNITGWNVDQPDFIPLDPSFKPENSIYRIYVGSEANNTGNDWPVDLYRNETLLMERGTSSGGAYTLCTGNYRGASTLKVKVKGFCDETEYDVEYWWNWQGSYGMGLHLRYMGPQNGSIYFVKDGLWRINKVRLRKDTDKYFDLILGV